MNIHLCQSLQSICEVKELLTTAGECFVSSQDSKPMVTIKQDTMSGSYKLTYGRVPIDVDIFFDVISWLNLDHCLNKIEKIRRLYSTPIDAEKISHLRGLIKRAKTEATKQKHEATIAELMKGGEPSDEVIYNGHSLFSCLLPDGFEYVCDNNMSPDGRAVVIADGIMLSGTLNKEALGNISGSLIHHISKDYGNKVAADFVSNLQIVINCWLQHHGLTVGLQDCIPLNTEICDGEMNKCILEAYGVMQSEKDPDLLELKLSAALNKATSLGQKISKAALKPDNNMVTMIRSGSKGNWFNISQVTGLVGQQNVMGKRLEKHWGGRTLPHYRRTGWLSASTDTVSTGIDMADTDKVLDDALNLFKSRGFVYNSYFKGLEPAEYFFHAAGGREGLIDTACKSVGAETEITIVENGMVRRVQIGSWIDEKMEANETKIRRSHYLDQELLDLDKPVQIQTIDDFGNASWENLTAVTRHNPTPNVYFVKTESGCEAVIADSETLLIWNGKTFEKKKTSEVRVGDEVPVLLPLQYEATQVVNDVFKDEIIKLEKIQLDAGKKLYDVTVPKTLNFCLANGLCVRDKDVSLTASCRNFCGKTVLLASREKIAARLLNCGKCVKLQEPSIYVARDNDLGYGKILEDKTIANPHRKVPCGPKRSTTKGAVGLF